MSNNRTDSTSPSIYANFYSLSASDNCGGSLISSMMLSISAGELSTIVGNLDLNHGVPYRPHLTTQRFDFKDLTCPPQSVMIKTRDQTLHALS